MSARNDSRFIKHCNKRLSLLCRKEDIVATIGLLNKFNSRDIICESGLADGYAKDGQVTTDVKNQNITDVLGVDENMMDAGQGFSLTQGISSRLDMGDFLSRPVEIYNNTFAINAVANVSVNVWSLFFGYPSVRAKIRNFAFFHGDLKLRIVLSGTPFHYGRLLFSYQPYYSSNAILGALLTQYSLNAGVFPLLNNYLSQAPGAFTMNVNENKPVEFTCPYISTKPMHRLFNNSSAALGSATPFADMDETGTLYITGLTPIGCVSSTGTSIYMQIYAWVDNPEFGTTTGTQIVIATEAGVADERQTGPVEMIASRVATVSDALVSVPFLAPFATASSFIAKGIGKIASIFGWSKPVIISAPSFMKPQPYYNGALTIGYDTSKRIVLDPKQELSITPQLTGSNEDEMTLQHIFSRMSYLNQFSWAPGTPTLVSPLWACRVNPCLTTNLASGVLVSPICQPTAMAFAAAPFYAWRGDITYRFEIVCSKFHRGKLAIYFEPNQAQYSIITPAVSLNKHYMKIVDIQETQCVDVCVKWATYRPWLLVNTAANARLNTDDPGNATEGMGYCNGFIAVTPYTDLQSPDASTILVNVYVSSENMHFNGLTQWNMPQSRTITTAMLSSDVIEVESGYLGAENSQEVTCFDLNESTASAAHISELCFGEEPLSFRSLLKRYVTAATFAISATAGSTTQGYVRAPIFPLSNAPLTSGTYQGIAFWDLFSYLRYSYLGTRGGIRYRFHMNTPYGDGNTSNIQTSLLPPATGFVSAWSGWTTGAGTAWLDGTVAHIASTNGGVEVELPYYSNNLFQLPWSTTLDSGVSTENMNGMWFRNFVTYFQGSGNTTAGRLDLDVASAEDFMFMRFQGACPYAHA